MITEQNIALPAAEKSSLLPLVLSLLLIIGLVAVDTGAVLRVLYRSGYGSFYVSSSFGRKPFIGKLAYHFDCLSSWLETRFTRAVIYGRISSDSLVAESVGFDHSALHRYHSLISAAARNHELDPNLIKAVIAVESKFNASAISPAGASGLMQLMPATAAHLGVKDIFDPEQNINGGTKYLRHLLKRFKGDMHFALAAYNAGPTAVANHGGIPPYPETRRYVSKVVATYEALRQTNA